MELYHVLNRAVEKRPLFLDARDYERFVQNLQDFNDTKPATHDRIKNGGLRNPRLSGDVREQIVTIHAWCLMKNHYHLLLSERTEGGITTFVRKINVGYANYFNERYTREGALFQGRTKKKIIDSDSYFLHILHYIHLNPLDYARDTRGWRERQIHNASNALRQIKNYRWSSYRDYCNNKGEFPSVVDTGLFRDVFGNVEKTTSQYLRSIDIAVLKPYTLE